MMKCCDNNETICPECANNLVQNAIGPIWRKLRELEGAGVANQRHEAEAKGQTTDALQDTRDNLLKSCFAAFNEIPRKLLHSNDYKDTYEIAAAIEAFFRDKE